MKNFGHFLYFFTNFTGVSGELSLHIQLYEYIFIAKQPAAVVLTMEPKILQKLNTGVIFVLILASVILLSSQSSTAFYQSFTLCT